MTDREFEKTVEEAIEALPQELQDVLQECTVIIADWADVELMQRIGIDEVEDTPYGYYDGTPVGERGPTENTMLLPDRIFLFRGPLIEDFPEREELVEEIRVTLFHELGHMIGLDEDDMEERGLE
jgi:predicted Zn-dependent protease with MMP-like domain